MFYLFNRYNSTTLLAQWLSESIIVFLTAILVAVVRLYFDNSAVINYDPLFIKTGVMTVTYAVFFYYFGLYTPDMYRPTRTMFTRLLKATMTGTITLFGIFFLIPSLRAWRGIFLGNSLVLPIVILGWRAVFTRFLRFDLPHKNLLIIGSGELAKKIGREIYHRPEHGLKLVGFVDDDPAKFGISIVNPGVIGGYGDITRIAESEKIDKIIVALADRRARLPMSALLDCKLKGVSIEEGATFNERMTGNIPLGQLKPSWIVFSDGFKSLRSRKILKRVLDLLLVLVCLVITSPVFIVAAILIKLTSRGPVIFSQVRVGEHGKRFLIYKFRSMRHGAEDATGPVWAKPGDKRVTRVGRFIRRLRIDELPQLINVIKGDMSFVGPRPERPFFADKLKESILYYEMRTVVKPGLTGWAQIKYPHGVTFDDAVEKLQYDLFYIKNMSLLLDLIIIFETVKVVVTGKVQYSLCSTGT